MELALLIILMITVGNPKWLGKHMSQTQQWYDYFRREKDKDVYHQIVRQRAKNIRKIRNERFKNNDS